METISSRMIVARAARATQRFTCRACGAMAASRTRTMPDRMFQSGGAFTYSECAVCGAWSLVDVPADLERHYPSRYGAFGRLEPVSARTWRDRCLDLDFSGPARLVAALVPERTAKILDIGAGNGRMLRDLTQAGYTHVRGVDAHLPDALRCETPYRLERGTIEDCPHGWDVIMYHHALEHVVDPLNEIRRAVERLGPGGQLILRTPLADSWARQHYGTYWLQWDAPRHLWLPTRAAIARIATEAGLVVRRTIDDGCAASLWASRLYRRGLSPANPSDVYPRRRQLVEALPVLAADKAWVRWLNWRGQSDQAAFVLEKAR